MDPVRVEPEGGGEVSVAVWAHEQIACCKAVSGRRGGVADYVLKMV